MEGNMTDQFSLFPEPHDPKSRSTDPSTSHAAAVYLNIGKVEQEVMWAISKHPDGAIYDEVVALLPHRRVHSIQPRFAPLRRSGQIVKIGERRSKLSGRNQSVYILGEQDDTKL
jgi:hypothetical protein